MKIGKACVIFGQIEKDEYTEQDKLQAIKEVIAMPTHNGITKDEILNAFRWFFGWAVEQTNAKPTNADRILAMSDDERADAILDNSDKCLGDLIPFCQNTPECTDLLENGDDIPKEMCRKCLIEWLQSEVEE